jgi:hypothetical protein
MNEYASNKSILFGERDDWKDVILSNTAKMSHQVSFQYFTLDVDYTAYDLIIPLSVHDQFVLNKFISQQKKPIKALFASHETVQLANDKHLFNKFLTYNGFGYVIPAYKKKGDLPYILKKRVGEFGVGCYLVINAKDEENYQEFISDSDHYYLQEVVRGEKEYTTHIAYLNGLLYHLTFEFIYFDELFIKGTGTVGKKATVIDTPFLELWTEILEKMLFNGIGCFNYKILD